MPAPELTKGGLSDIDADLEMGDVEPMPTQAGMEISFKVLSLPRPVRAPEARRMHMCTETTLIPWRMLGLGVV